ncbi:MAG: hypothetical protein JO007_11210 [Alphaproteobacteria bacterium]|nr:hypothetical protein [Alphaproteobacteria bacterium]
MTTKFDRERALVGHLLNALGLNGAALHNPNAAGSETGIDVSAHLSDGRLIGIQVTELDPHARRGTARASEKGIARAVSGKPYFMWGQNDSSIILNALANTIRRKVQIAAHHSFQGIDEVWLLICAGVPEHGAIASTFVMTPWLSPEDMNLATNYVLSGSKYDHCFLLPILGVEQALYQWGSSGWEKLVTPRNIREAPREVYVKALMKAAKVRDWQEVDRLCEQECRKVLAEIRQA